MSKDGLQGGFDYFTKTLEELFIFLISSVDYFKDCWSYDKVVIANYSVAQDRKKNWEREGSEIVGANETLFFHIGLAFFLIFISVWEKISTWDLLLFSKPYNSYFMICIFLF